MADPAGENFQCLYTALLATTSGLSGKTPEKETNNNKENVRDKNRRERV